MPFSACSPASANPMARLASRCVVSSASTCPGPAAVWIRAAVLTASPATMPSPAAPRFTATVPVTTPARAARPGTSSSRPSWPTAPTRSRAARTARSASSSVAVGVPHTAITASPMNFSVTPPYRPMISRATATYRESSSRTASGSRASASGVNPTRSQNSTEHTRRSATGVLPAGGAPWAYGVPWASRASSAAQGRLGQAVPAGTAEAPTGNDSGPAPRASRQGGTAITAEPVRRPPRCTARRAHRHLNTINRENRPVPPDQGPAAQTALRVVNRTICRHPSRRGLHLDFRQAATA